MNIHSIEAIFFDFDGVLADSLAIKADAFMSLFSGLSSQQAAAIRQHFYRFTGRSRQSKFIYVYENILRQTLGENQLEQLCQAFRERSIAQVIECREIPGTTRLLRALPPHIRKFVVSGTPETELNQIVRERGIADFFEACKGTPVPKERHIQQLLAEHKLQARHCVMLGDGKVDQQAAEANQLTFFGIAASDGSHPFSENTLVFPDMEAVIGHFNLASAIPAS